MRQRSAQKIGYGQSARVARVLALPYSILFCSVLFYSILFYSILFYSILFYSIRVNLEKRHVVCNDEPEVVHVEAIEIS
jgi:hypothetical protein